MEKYFGPYGLFLLLLPFVLLGVVLIVLASSYEPVRPLNAVAGGDPLQGPQAIVNYGCGSCHTIPGVVGADGKVGPPLTGLAERSFIAGVLPNNTDNLVMWIQHPQSVLPGNDMPDLNVTDPAARDIVAYLYALR